MSFRWTFALEFLLGRCEVLLPLQQIQFIFSLSSLSLQAGTEEGLSTLSLTISAHATGAQVARNRFGSSSCFVPVCVGSFHLSSTLCSLVGGPGTSWFKAQPPYAFRCCYVQSCSIKLSALFSWIWYINQLVSNTVLLDH